MEKQFTMTHLRIDTIIYGVLLAVIYNLEYTKAKMFFRKNKVPLFLVSIFNLLSIGFINSIDTPFIRILGFSLIALSFFILTALSIFLNFEAVNKNKFVSLFSKLGLASYSIYLTHPYLIQIRYALQYRLPVIAKYELFFSFVFLLVYILVGYFIYYFVERKILKLKNKFRNQTLEPNFKQL
jgi:peptidoglycan/LPS O-acetylase OafA/YrhL